MINFKNSNYNLDDSIFNIREIDYNKIEVCANDIVKSVESVDIDVKTCQVISSNYSKSELYRTISDKLEIQVEQKDEKIIDVSLMIPRLIDKNYIMINGQKKIPMFQIIDTPIITRNDSKRKEIRLNTNVTTMIFSKKENSDFNYYVMLYGKSIPMCIVAGAYYGIEKFGKLFSEDIENIENIDEPYKSLISDFKTFYENSLECTEDDLNDEMGRFFTKYDFKGRGSDIIYSLDLLLMVDPFTRYFMDDNILDTIIRYIKEDINLDDTDLINKRIRCFEYVILKPLSKIIFDLCMTVRKYGKRTTFKTPITQLLALCNVSDIIHYDFSINPIGSLTLMGRSSLLGPGGFKKNKVPIHLRDISKSMFGRLDIVDTPDRDSCGVVQSLLPNTEFKEVGLFGNENEDQTVSLSVAMAPFLNNDDQTRLKMESSQMRQAVMLEDFDQALVQSGCESFYTDYTDFVFRADKDGEIVYHNRLNGYMVLKYDDGETEFKNLSFTRKLYSEHLDLLKVYFTNGDKFNKGDIIAESYFCEDSRINVGKNLLTAVWIYYGYNYEDGIVISEKVEKEGLLKSTHFVDLSFELSKDEVLMSLSCSPDPENYKPIPNKPEIGEDGKIIYIRLSANQPYAIIKKIGENSLVFSEPRELSFNKEVIITDVEIYANDWNKDIVPYSDWVEKTSDNQRDERIKTKDEISEFFNEEELDDIERLENLDLFSTKRKFQERGEKISGVKVVIKGLFRRNIKVGDKIGNRHGNKGIISTIIPKEQMPRLEDGREIDVIINPLGIISRMNIGQLFELHMSMSVNDLKDRLFEMIEKEESEKDKKNYILGYIKIIDNTDNNWYFKQSEDYLEKEDILIDKKFVKNFFVIQPPFQSCTEEMLKKALEYTGTVDKYKIYDPIYGDNIHNPISVGYMYFFKMVHMAEERLSVRGIGHSYSAKTLQPLGGKRRFGGQKLGEMEVRAMIAMDGLKNLQECITVKSDSVESKANWLKNKINLYGEENEEFENEDNVPESVKILKAYLNSIGIDIEND